jgi:hypothetical protein
LDHVAFGVTMLAGSAACQFIAAMAAGDRHPDPVGAGCTLFGGEVLIPRSGGLVEEVEAEVGAGEDHADLGNLFQVIEFLR